MAVLRAMVYYERRKGIVLIVNVGYETCPSVDSVQRRLIVLAPIV